MSASAHLLVTLLLFLAAVPALAHARWTLRSPGTAVIAWQLLAFTGVLCVIGLLIAVGLAPYQLPLHPALAEFAADLSDGFPLDMTLFRFAALGAAAVITVLFPVTATISTVRVLRIRRRQRELLALVGYADAAAPGAVVIPHAQPMAYCVPGFRPRIVLSAGALATLDRAQLAAVLGHERAHASERHDLVLVPFTTLRRLLPHSHWAARMSRIVTLLLEMRADDRACRTSTPSSLHAALRQFQIAGGSAPAGALGIGGGDDGGGDDIAARLHRLADPRPPLHIRWAALAATMVLAATPVSLFLWPYP